MSKQIDLLFGVEGGGLVDGASGRRIKNQIESIAKEINTKDPIEIAFKADTTAISAAKEQIENIKTLISTMPGLNITINDNKSGTDKGIDKAKELAQTYNKVRKELTELSAREADLSKLAPEMPETKAYEATLARLRELSKNLLGDDGLAKPLKLLDKNAKNDIQTFYELFAKVSPQLQLAKTATKAYKDETNATAKAAKTNATESLAAAKLLSKVWTSYSRFKNIKDYPELDAGYTSLINNLSNKTSLTSEEVKDFTKKLNNLEAQSYKAGVAADTLGEAIDKKIGDRLKYLVGQFAINFVVRGLRMIYDSVVQIDRAMTELRKVTNATSEEYDRFLSNASVRAKALGATLVETINATADFARLGYNIEEASNLADSAIVYTNVGDGLSGMDEATKHLISTMTAFGIASKNTMHIVDIFNEVANNYAVSASDIGTGLQRSSAAMRAAGNSLEETVAIFTAANTIAQDADVVGTALKTMSMRLRSTKTEMEAAGEDTEGMAESVSSLRDELLSLTGVDIQLDDNTYKSSYKMLQDISKVWGQLNDLTRANVLELLFGKRQASIGSGLLQNFDIAEKALETTLNSSGSALRENDVYLESIQGHLDQLTASWQVLSANVLDSGIVKLGVDFLKGIVNLLNSIIEATNKMGISWLGVAADIALVGAAIEALRSFKEVKTLVSYLASIKQTFDALKKVDNIFQAVKPVSKVLENTTLKTKDHIAKLLISLTHINPVLAAIAGGLLVLFAIGTKLISNLKIENQLKDIEEAKNKYKSISEELNSYNSQLEENKNRIKEIEEASQGDFSITDSEEIARLKAENELLEAQIQYKRTLQDLAHQETVKETKDAFYKTFGYRRIHKPTGGFYWGESGSYSSSKGYGQSAYLDSYVEMSSQLSEIESELAKEYAAGNPFEDYTEKLEAEKAQLMTLLAEMKANLLQFRLDLINETDEDSIAIVKAITRILTFDGSPMSGIINDSQFSEIFDAITEKGARTFRELENLGISDTVLQAFRAALEAAGYEIEDVANELNGLDNTEVNVAFSIDTSELDATREKTKSLSSSLSSMSKAFAEQAENGQLSVDTIFDVMEAGYAGALAINQNTGAVTINKEAYAALAQAEILEQIAKLQGIKASYQQQLANLNEAETTDTLTGAVRRLTAAEIQENAIKLNKYITDIDAQLAILSQIDMSKVTSGLYGVSNAASSAKSSISNLQSGMKSLLSTTMDWLRKEYDQASESAKEYYDSQIDGLKDAQDVAKDRWDAEKEALKEQLDNYNDLIDAQIELLRREKEADEYSKQRADKEKVVSDIENQLLAIENDDSIEAQKIRLELQEQLAEAKEELDNLQTDREYDLREQALQDEKDRYEKEVNAKLDAIDKMAEAEDKAYQKQIDNLQKKLDAVQAATISEAQIREEAYDWIENREEELYKHLSQYNYEYGDGLTSTVDALFQDADGWRAWGSTFEEALNNIARYLREAEDGIGGVSNALQEEMDELLGILKEWQKNLIAVGDEAGAQIISDFMKNLGIANALGLELTGDMVTAIKGMAEENDTALLEMTGKCIQYFSGLAVSGAENAEILWAGFQRIFTEGSISISGFINSVSEAIARGDTETVRYLADIGSAMNVAESNGYEFSQNMSNNIGLIAQSLWELRDKMPTDVFDRMWQNFINDIAAADQALFIHGQNMVNNYAAIARGAMGAATIASYIRGGAVSNTRGYMDAINDIGNSPLHTYAEGGIIDYTGPAIVHGSNARPEVVFNADAAAKLYDYVTNTPDLFKSVLNSITSGELMFRGVAPINNASTVGDIVINVQGDASASTVEELKKIASSLKEEVVRNLNDSMSRRGITRSPRTI